MEVIWAAPPWNRFEWVETPDWILNGQHTLGYWLGSVDTAVYTR